MGLVLSDVVMGVVVTVGVLGGGGNRLLMQLFPTFHLEVG